MYRAGEAGRRNIGADGRREGGSIETEHEPPVADPAAVVVLLNAAAAGARRRRAFLASLRAGAQAEGTQPPAIVETHSAEEGRDRAHHAAAAGAQTVVAAGGDGTIQSVVRGLLAHGRTAADRPRLAIAPLGRGNDLARSLGLARRVEAAGACLRNGHDRLLDVGRAVVDGVQHVFVNAFGMGLDAAVARRAHGLRLPGPCAYTVGTVLAVLTERGPWHVTGTLDEAPLDREITLLHIGNGGTTGGGFRLTPQASPFDGWLDTCAYLERRRRRILSMLPQAALGLHRDHPAVRLGRLRRLDLRIRPGACVHADGEPVARSATHVQIEVEGGALRVRVPGPSANWYPPSP